MVKLCCVKICGSRSGNELTLFKVPKDPTKNEKWMEKLSPYLSNGRKCRKLLYVCEKHFIDDDIQRDFSVILGDGSVCNTGPRQMLRLKPTSVPSVFKERPSIESIPANNLDKTSIPANNIDKSLIPANNVEKSLIPANNVDQTVVPANNIDKSVEIYGETTDCKNSIIIFSPCKELNPSQEITDSDSYCINTLVNDLNILEQSNVLYNWMGFQFHGGLTLAYFGDNFTCSTRSIFIANDMTVEVRIFDRMVNVDGPKKVISLKDVLLLLSTVNGLQICIGVDDKSACPHGFFKQLPNRKSQRCCECQKARKKLIDAKTQALKRSILNRKRCIMEKKNFKKKTSSIK